MAFELLEWAAASLFGKTSGSPLGAQGDSWDTHKDMGLAAAAALLAMGITAAINASLQRDFARELAESLRVKGRRPLGEDEIARLLGKRRR